MVALGLSAPFAVIRSRINHLLRSTFLSIAFRTFFFVFFLFFAMQLSIFLNRSYIGGAGLCRSVTDHAESPSRLAPQWWAQADSILPTDWLM